MSFRQYGGINYAARNNIVKTNFTNANNLSIMTKVGQPESKINVQSTLDVYAINLTSPTITTNENGVVPKSYVDATSSGLKPMAACQCATTVVLSGNVNPTVGTYSTLTIDGYVVVTGDRVLIKNQQDISSSYTGSVYNGIYDYTIVSGLGTFARSSDYAVGNDAYGAYVLITNGTINGNKSFIELNPGMVGTSVLLFTQFTASFAIGQGLEKVSTGSSTVIQVKSDLSTSPFITSLAVSGATTVGSLTVSGTTSTSTVNGANLTINTTNFPTCTSSLALLLPGDSSNSVPTCAWVQTAISNNTGTYATTSYVNSTFQTIAGMSLYLTTSAASATYQPISGMSLYLTTSAASATYQPISGMSLYLTTSAASATYQPISGMGSYALLASPALTGIPTAPTATAGTNTTQIATTAYVQSAVSGGTAGSSHIYGTGVDGNLTFNGGSVSGFTYSSSVYTYTMTREVYASNITMEGGFIINPGKYRLFCSGTFTSNTSANYIIGDGEKGGTGIYNGAGGAGGAGAQNGGAAGGAAGGNGGSVDNTTGATVGLNTWNSFNTGNGGGGTGGQNLYTPAVGGITAVSSILPHTNFWNSYLNIYTMFDRDGNYYSGGAGGGGGSGGYTGNTVASGGGGGGGGGGVIAVFVLKFILNSTLSITANGGAGGDGPSGGGGGGGGGGLVLFCTSSSTSANLIVTANGGTPGVVPSGYVAAGSGVAGIVSAFYNLS
jgi:hypothetical protein